jgi:hypothetical protein
MTAVPSFGMGFGTGAKGGAPGGTSTAFVWVVSFLLMVTSAFEIAKWRLKH